MNIETLKFSIGKFKIPRKIKQSYINQWIKDIETPTNSLQHKVKNLLILEK